MIDREKIVCAIENCIGLPKCKDCPWEDCEVEHEVVNRVPYGLLRDALVLLKKQESEEKRILKIVWDILHSGVSTDRKVDQDWVYEQIRNQVHQVY